MPTCIELISEFLIFFIFYACAYKKPGTKLLNLVLVIGALLFFFKFYGVCRFLAGSSIKLPSPYTSLLSWAFDSALYIWWFIASIRLSEANEKLQKQTAEAS